MGKPTGFKMSKPPLFSPPAFGLPKETSPELVPLFSLFAFFRVPFVFHKPGKNVYFCAGALLPGK